MKVSKVSKVKKASGTSSRKVNSKEPIMAFEEVMAVTEENNERSHLDDLLDAIKEQGRSLSENRDIGIMLAYKEMVKDFIEEAVNFGLKISERRGYGRAGRSKVMRMVSMIDEKLIDLTEKLLKEEQTSLKLLAKVGAIEGLLLNLYA